MELKIRTHYYAENLRREDSPRHFAMLLAVGSAFYARAGILRIDRLYEALVLFKHNTTFIYYTTMTDKCGPSDYYG